LLQWTRRVAAIFGGFGRQPDKHGIEYSIRLGGAFDAMPAAARPDERSCAAGPEIDDRHLLDGVAKASDRTAEDAAGSLMAGIIAAAMV
jgi:hypothetical protein